MKQFRLFAIAALALVSTSCVEDWLKEKSPMTTEVSDFFTSSETAVQVTNAAYAPLAWEYQGTYFSEFFFGDILSDDALKGGQNVTDGSDAYQLDNFKILDNNAIVLQYYRAQYQGVARANLALEQIEAMGTSEDDLTPELKNRLLAEAHFLRAYYYFRLVRLYGGVPIVTTPIYSSNDWIQPRATAEKVYELILSDLKVADQYLPLKSEYASEDLGRATKGAAQAMLLKVSLYNHDYPAAKSYGEAFLAAQASEYELCSDYADNFTLAGENGVESVFEVQYMEEGTSDYGEGNGFSRGTFTTILTRSRSSKFANPGWGFNRPTKSLYDEFEAGDPRRDATILVPKESENPEESEITNPEEEIYLGNSMVGIKRTIFDPVTRHYSALAHDARSAINKIEIRLADVYLMYAEACIEQGDLATAASYIERVRDRVGLDAVDGSSKESLTAALRHERRCELAMEGHRWFDLCRWGIADQVMNAYKASENEEVRAEMGDFVKGKHELMPIPYEEVRMGKLEQNPGY